MVVFQHQMHANHFWFITRLCSLDLQRTEINIKATATATAKQKCLNFLQDLQSIVRRNALLAHVLSFVASEPRRGEERREWGRKLFAHIIYDLDCGRLQTKRNEIEVKRRKRNRKGIVCQPWQLHTWIYESLWESYQISTQKSLLRSSRQPCLVGASISIHFSPVPLPSTYKNNLYWFISSNVAMEIMNNSTIFWFFLKRKRLLERGTSSKKGKLYCILYHHCLLQQTLSKK